MDASLHASTEALLHLDALPGDNWEAALREVLRVDSNILGVECVSYWRFRVPASIVCELGQLPNREGLLLPGAYVQVSLPLQSSQALTIPANTLMFRARRTSYGVTEQNWRDVATEVARNGGIPFVVSHRPLPLKPTLTSRRDGRILYQVTPTDLGPGRTTAPPGG